MRRDKQAEDCLRDLHNHCESDGKHVPRDNGQLNKGN